MSYIVRGSLFVFGVLSSDERVETVAAVLSGGALVACKQRVNLVALGVLGRVVLVVGRIAEPRTRAVGAVKVRVVTPTNDGPRFHAAPPSLIVPAGASCTHSCVPISAPPQNCAKSDCPKNDGNTPKRSNNEHTPFRRSRVVGVPQPARVAQTDPSSRISAIRLPCRNNERPSECVLPKL